MGFAWVCVRINLRRPLRSGFLVKGPVGPFWQPFVYECLDGVCLRCGLFHSSKKSYQSEEDATTSLEMDNLLRPEEVDDEQMPASPPLRPWLLAVHRWEV